MLVVGGEHSRGDLDTVGRLLAGHLNVGRQDPRRAHLEFNLGGSRQSVVEDVLVAVRRRNRGASVKKRDLRRPSRARERTWRPAKGAQMSMMGNPGT